MTNIETELLAVAKRIDEVSRTISKLAINKCEFERQYRESLSKEIVRLLDEGKIPVHLIRDVAVGNLCFLQHEYNKSAALFEAGVGALGAIREQANVLVSVSKLQGVQ
jgi:DNA polymerase II small subunit/DNA polymerase delta subunit B